MESRNSSHRDGSLRAPWWDYQSTGAYFITICTGNKKACFGHIVNEIMCLSIEGAIAYQFWESIPNHFPFIRLGEFIVMPDHVHGILFIDRDYSISKVQVPYMDLGFDYKNLADNSDSGYLFNLDDKSKQAQWMSFISPKRGSLASVVRSYKSTVSKYCRSVNPDFSWQPLYFERIITNEMELYQISEYIWLNPKRWRDKLT